MLLALFDGSLITNLLWFAAGLSIAYLIPAPKFVTDRFGKKN